MKTTIKIILACYLFFESCSATRVIKPLEKDQQSLSIGIGGPLINFADMTIPIPLTSISYQRGITDDYTLSAGLHTTSLLFGVVQNDIGITKGLLEASERSPGLSGTIIANTMIGLNEETTFRLYPEVNLNIYYPIGLKNSYVYGGVGTWVELKGQKAHSESAEQVVLPSFYLGLNYSRPKLNYVLEFKSINPFVSNNNIVVDYELTGEKGATGVYFSINKFIGK